MLGSPGVPPQCTDSDEFDVQVFHGTELICKNVNGQWKIVLPEPLVGPTITWYHSTMGHPGITRLSGSLRTHLWFPRLQDRVAAHVATCEHCQRYKAPGRGYGHLPPRDDTAQPWEEVAVDCVGRWSITLSNGQRVDVHALTIIDVCTTLSECIRIEDKTAQHQAVLFVNHWLSRYPRPLRVIHDQGTECVGLDFQAMLVTHGIQAVPTSVRNPQANAVIERLHKTVQDLLNISLCSPPVTAADAIKLIDSCLAAAQRSLRSMVH